MTDLANPTDALSGRQSEFSSSTVGMRSLTPARIALQRAGDSVATGVLLDFQLAHARARDAVHAELQPTSLIAGLQGLLALHPHLSQQVLLLHSAAKDRQIYLQRPDLGRRLDDISRQRLEERGTTDLDLAIVLADGLSALAVDRYAVPLLTELLPLLREGLRPVLLAPICVVEQARVAVGDEIGHTLGASLSLVLIGERPGLSAHDSLGAYITWNPRPGITSDAQRNCISNIRPEGLSFSESAARLIYYIHEARRCQLTGVALKDPQLHLAESTL